MDKNLQLIVDTLSQTQVREQCQQRIPPNPVLPAEVEIIPGGSLMRGEGPIPAWVESCAETEGAREVKIEESS